MERRNEFISTLKQGDCEVTAMKRLKFHQMPAEVVERSKKLTTKTIGS